MNFTGKKTEIQQFINKIDNEVIYDVKIEKHREKKTLDQNGLAWAVINEIGNVLRMSKEEVYLSMLRAYGQRDYILLESRINPSDYFKYYEKNHSFKQGEVSFTSYLVYRGISTYDTKEMSIFIDGLLSEAEQLGIESRAYLDLKEMKNSDN